MRRISETKDLDLRSEAARLAHNSVEPLRAHHPEIQKRLRKSYTRRDLRELRQFLTDAGAFEFRPMRTGLFPAADLPDTEAAHTGYGNVWVRDNIHVAHAMARIGRVDQADRAVLSLASFYQNHRSKIVQIVRGARSHHNPMNRPHIRFNGAELIEDPQEWPHAQNDALGYFIWFYCQRALDGAFAPDFDLIELFALYFERIEYWRDADCGHWEEREKVEASSIGCIVAALRAAQTLRMRGDAVPWRRGITDERMARLLVRGEEALDAILPYESRGPGRRSERRYDSALLFLVYPLDVVSEPMSRHICDDVVGHLMGEWGVRRYLEDSYWTADYKRKLRADAWSGAYSLYHGDRDRLAERGAEAQWCLFDPILSVIAGRRYLKSRAEKDRREQVFHFNRSLAQITGPDCPQGPLRCPEAYYSEDRRYVPNDHSPLLWTQANLLCAFLAMDEAAES